MRIAKWTLVVGLGAAMGAAAAEAVPLAELRARLQSQDQELVLLRARLEQIDDGRWLNLAAQIGVSAALEDAPLTDRQRGRIAIAIAREAGAAGLDPLLLVALIRTESAFDCYAVSGAGAMGLMQITPRTAGWLAPRRGERLGRTSNLFDSDLNVHLGTAYLVELLGRFGSLEHALVAYNVGPAQARKLLSHPESRLRALRGYPQRIALEYRRLKDRQEARWGKEGLPRLPALVATTRSHGPAQ